MSYEPLRPIARWAIFFLAVAGLLDAIGVVADWNRFDLLGRIESGGSFTLTEAEASDDRNTLIGILQFVALVLTAMAFLRWFLRAYRNLDALGSGRRYRAGWAIGAWFVPILNLWRPKQIANDIWRGSDPRSPGGSPWGGAPVSPLLAFWWGFFLASGWTSNVGARLAFGGSSAGDLRAATGAALVGDALDFVAAALAVAVVWRLTAREEERAERHRATATAAG